MTDRPGAKPSGYVNTLTAPVVYFDAPIVWGAFSGVIQIELGIRASVPSQGGEDVAAETEVHVSGRLRCSPSAARRLRDALDRALAMLEQPQAAAAVVGKLN
jgi:hypothetical protein